MKITLPSDLSNLKPDDPDMIRWVSQALAIVVTAVNGNLSFSDNLQCQLVTVIFNAANTQQAISHNLAKVPFGYLKMSSKAAATLYDGTSLNTTQILYLQSTVATTVRLLIF